MNNINHEAIDVPLYSLIADEKLVRETPASKQDLQELVASIRAHGQLNPLTVLRRKEPNTYRVIAGNRRLAALNEMHKAGELPGEHLVKCMLVSKDTPASAQEIALAENVARVAMHPADQVIVFRQLVERGQTADQIATRFGLAKVTVQRRLRIGGVSKTIMDAFRAGKIPEDVVCAFATTEDTDRQDAVFAAMEQDNSNWGPRTVMSKLREGFARSDSPIAIYVGEKAYRERGGSVEETLFDKHSIWHDTELLVTLAQEKLERAAKRQNGWKWVETTLNHNEMWQLRQDCQVILMPAAEYTDAEMAAINALSGFEEQHGISDPRELSAEIQEKYNELYAAGEEAQNAAESRREYTEEQKAVSGVVLYINHAGKLDRIEGLVRPEDQEPEPGAPAAQQADKAKSEGYSRPVQETIAELRSAAIRDALRNSPGIASDLLLFHLILLLGNHGGSGSLALHREALRRWEVPGASDEVEAFLGPKIDLSAEVDPKVALDEAFAEFCSQDDGRKEDLLAEIVGQLLETPTPGVDLISDALAGGLKIDFASKLLTVHPAIWSVDTFWGRLRKDQIIETCTPFLGEEWAKEAKQLKKGALAKDAAERMRAHPEWLPKGF